VAEIKDKEPNPDLESDSENTSKRQIIDADPRRTNRSKRGGAPFSFTDVDEGDPAAFYCL
jgi:hypothetical protein